MRILAVSKLIKSDLRAAFGKLDAWAVEEKAKADGERKEQLKRFRKQRASQTRDTRSLGQRCQGIHERCRAQPPVGPGSAVTAWTAAPDLETRR